MSQRKPILPQSLTPNPAFSPAVQVGELLFISGQVAQDNDGNTVGVGDCEAQTHHIMARIRTIVEAAGATMPDAVKITTFLTNIDNFKIWNPDKVMMSTVVCFKIGVRARPWTFDPGIF